MQPLVSQIHNLLIKKRKTIAVAESCTGGLTCSLLTHLSGSSSYFILGIIAYSNKVKEAILRIPASLISEKGAVSQDIALRMAASVRILSRSDFGIGITGIAGPTGGTRKKPAGTVFIAIDCAQKITCKKFRFTGNRTTVRNKAAFKSLKLLKELIETTT